MKLKEIMVADVIQISSEESVAVAAKRMREKGVGCLVVTEDSVVKGIITDRDLLGCLGEGHDPYRCNIVTHMSHPVIVIRPEEDHVTGIGVMRRRRIKRLPVAERGKLLGIVSLSDLAQVTESDMEKLWPSWVSISDLVRTQAIQGQRGKIVGVRPKPAAETGSPKERDRRNPAVIESVGV
jgi:CBS domain-containing protein